MYHAGITAMCAIQQNVLHVASAIVSMRSNALKAAHQPPIHLMEFAWNVNNSVIRAQATLSVASVSVLIISMIRAA